MLSIGLTLAFVFTSAFIDYEVLKWSYIYDHKSRFIQRILFFACMSLFSINGALGGALLFTALFDGILNKLRGLDLFYLGNTATWDKFFNTKPLLYICVKVVSLFVGVLLCLI
jgi:hypothetical protein